MLVSVGEKLEGFEIIEYKEVVFGVARSVEGVAYRQLAMKKIVDSATKVGANAIINLKMEICSIGQNVQEITFYGDAVLIKIEGTDDIPGNKEKSKIKLEDYIPKLKKDVLNGEFHEIGDFKFVVCPNCGTKYKVEIDSDGNIHIKGFDDVDDVEPGLQVFCLRCGTKFTVPEN